jgi:hypothetical protein
LFACCNDQCCPDISVCCNDQCCNWTCMQGGVCCDPYNEGGPQCPCGVTMTASGQSVPQPSTCG